MATYPLIKRFEANSWRLAPTPETKVAAKPAALPGDDLWSFAMNALLANDAYQQNVARYTGDPNAPLVLRHFVHGVDSVGHALDALIRGDLLGALIRLSPLNQRSEARK